MNVDKTKLNEWFDEIALGLPEFPKIVQLLQSDVLLLGAVVFDVYSKIGWTKTLARTTGDLDLSVGLQTGADEYVTIGTHLKDNGYTVHERIPYRFLPPKQIPGMISYIDLLAHPMSDSISQSEARQTIGVGPGFSFDSMKFAQQTGFRITDRLVFPNPLGFVALKAVAYRDEPAKRVKDLADIAQLTWGLVAAGTHFEMQGLWDSIKTHEDALFARSVLSSLAGDSSSEWDLYDSRAELLKRGFTEEQIEEDIPSSLEEWVDRLIV